jgi:RND family efflux transporter MFP subunit
MPGAFLPQKSTLIALPLLVLALAGCKDTKPPEPEIRPVRTIVVDPKPIEDDRQAVGEIRPRQESDIGFRISGKLISRLVDTGARVRKGDALARLDEQDYQNRLKQAQADVTSAEAVEIEARAAEGRLSQLLERGSTTRANYDSALKNMRSAEARVEQAKASLALARDQLAYTELKADFDGIVTATGAEAGQVLNAGQMVVRLAKPNEKDAVFNVAESVFRDQSPNNRPLVGVSLLSFPGEEIDAQVREVSPVADPATRTYQVKAALIDPPESFRFGASVLGRLKTNTAPVTVVPNSAIYDKEGKPAVWVVNPASMQVALKPVVLARFETSRTIINSGVEKGDIVVTAGVNRLREGQKVRLLNGAEK